MNEDRKRFMSTIVQAVVLVFVLALEDPEFRRNVTWCIDWTAERLRARLSPDDDEPPAPDVSKVLQAAREITERGE